MRGRRGGATLRKARSHCASRKMWPPYRGGRTPRVDVAWQWPMTASKGRKVTAAVRRRQPRRAPKSMPFSPRSRVSRLRPNPALKLLGVVITMHDKRTALARDIRAQIQKVFGGKVFNTVITKSVRLEESPAYKESIFTFAPESTGATDYYSLCEEVIERAEARTA